MRKTWGAAALLCGGLALGVLASLGSGRGSAERGLDGHGEARDAAGAYASTSARPGLTSSTKPLDRDGAGAGALATPSGAALSPTTAPRVLGRIPSAAMPSTAPRSEDAASRSTAPSAPAGRVHGPLDAVADLARERQEATRLRSEEMRERARLRREQHELERAMRERERSRPRRDPNLPPPAPLVPAQDLGSPVFGLPGYPDAPATPTQPQSPSQ